MDNYSELEKDTLFLIYSRCLAHAGSFFISGELNEEEKEKLLEAVDKLEIAMNPLYAI